ncbi:MAG: hypothetical protein EBR09_17035 [Proteobacteria bacterium]|nr:hypothetical protein [Pseudomonadota bacterium]
MPVFYEDRVEYAVRVLAIVEEHPERSGLSKVISIFYALVLDEYGIARRIPLHVYRYEGSRGFFSAVISRQKLANAEIDCLIDLQEPKLKFTGKKELNKPKVGKTMRVTAGAHKNVVGEVAKIFQSKVFLKSDTGLAVSTRQSLEFVSQRTWPACSAGELVRIRETNFRCGGRTGILLDECVLNAPMPFNKSPAWDLNVQFADGTSEWVHINDIDTSDEAKVFGMLLG